MSTVRLNITMDENLYKRLKRQLPPKGRFISEAEEWKSTEGENWLERNEWCGGEMFLGWRSILPSAPKSGRHGAVVVSDDSCNAYGARVVVLPLTSNVSSSTPVRRS